MSEQTPQPYGQEPNPPVPTPPAPPAPYGAPQPPAPNPYGGGYGQAPAYAGGPPMHPGSLGYVQANFGQAASFGQRALALIIDSLISMIGLIPMIIGFILLAMGLPTDSYVDEFGMTQTTGGDSGLAITGGVLIGLGILISIAITIWNRIFKMGRTGQSVGKKVIGLKLIDDKTGQPIGAGQCFLRELVSNIVNQLIYLSYLWMLWDDNKQTLADKAVHSTVVVVPKG